MNQYRTRSLSDVELVQATAEQKPIVANLLELYCYDFSEFHEITLGPDGRFGYPNLPLYWIDPGRYPFLVRSGSELVGLIFVKRGSAFSGREDVWDMAEFFVIRSHRRHGAGTAMAAQAWRRFPGCWEVRVMNSNVEGAKFWQHAIAQFTGAPVYPERFEKDGNSWLLFSLFSETPA